MIRCLGGLLVGFSLLMVGCKDPKPEYKQVSKENSIQLIENPSENGSSLPRLFSNGSDLFFSWIAKKDSTATLMYTTYANGKWNPSESIIFGTDWFVNWADFPAIAENEGSVLTSFLQKSANGTYTYDVKLNLYDPEVKQWKKNFLLHNDQTKSEHGFVSMRPYTGNSFLVTWLDGRETVGKAHGGGQMTLRAAIVFKDGTVDYDTLLDDRVCDCCQTASAIGPDDEILVVYRDRSEDEHRDISLVRWDKSSGWSSPLTLGNDNWKIAGCPVNGPAIDTHGESAAVAWFTAASGKGEVQVAFSEDLGLHFRKPIQVDAGNATGRVDIELLNASEAVVIWMEPEGADEVIRLRKITSKGTMGAPITIFKTSAERASGFPQLELVGNTLFVAWTDVTTANSAIKTATLSLDKL